MKVLLNNKAVAFVKSIQDDLTDMKDKQLLILTIACLDECKKRGLTQNEK